MEWYHQFFQVPMDRYNLEREKQKKVSIWRLVVREHFCSETSKHGYKCEDGIQ